jgi:hypothetical protein
MWRPLTLAEVQVAACPSTPDVQLESRIGDRTASQAIVSTNPIDNVSNAIRFALDFPMVCVCVRPRLLAFI